MPMNGSLRVLVVDDHIGIRIGIASLIDAEHPFMQAVGCAVSATEALAQTIALQPDVVVLDVNLDGEDGLALIPSLQRAAACEVVVLTSLSDPQVALYARRMGARACVHKAAPAGELMLAIRACQREGHAGIEMLPSNAGVGMSHAVGSKYL